jgi:hypothetical protein
MAALLSRTPIQDSNKRFPIEMCDNSFECHEKSGGNKGIMGQYRYLFSQPVARDVAPCTRFRSAPVVLAPFSECPTTLEPIVSLNRAARATCEASTTSSSRTDDIHGSLSEIQQIT